jgi:hypothetical protein
VSNGRYHSLWYTLMGAWKKQNRFTPSQACRISLSTFVELSGRCYLKAFDKPTMTEASFRSAALLFDKDDRVKAQHKRIAYWSKRTDQRGATMKKLYSRWSAKLVRSRARAKRHA